MRSTPQVVDTREMEGMPMEPPGAPDEEEEEEEAEGDEEEDENAPRRLESWAVEKAPYCDAAEDEEAKAEV